MKQQIIEIIKQIIIIAGFSPLPISERLVFILRYFKYLIVSTIFPKLGKKVSFFGGREFEFYGSHKNLVLDHLTTHMKYYYPYYKKAKTIIDVGGSFGTFVVIPKYLNTEVKIVSFEVNEKSFGYLKRNSEDLHGVTVLNFAIGERIKEISYFAPEEFPEGSRLQSKGKNLLISKQITLDSFIISRKLKSISLVKIDTEGHELKVLQGFAKTINRCKCVIIETDFNLSNLRRVLYFMEKSAFRLVAFGDQNWDHKSGQISSMDLIFKNNE